MGRNKPMEFGDRLRVIRTTRGMSQAELGERAGIDPKFISHMETGKMLPNEKWGSRLRAALSWGPEEDAALDALNHGGEQGRAAENAA